MNAGILVPAIHSFLHNIELKIKQSFAFSQWPLNQQNIFRLSIQELFAGIQLSGAGAWYPAVAGHRLRGEE